MSVAARPLFSFDNSFVRELEGLYVPWEASAVPAPRLLALNDELAAELGADPDALRAPEGVAVLAGNGAPDGASPVAQAYAGHQFGGLSPRLGDGRALLLGEVLDVHGRRRDLHLKGSGATPFARGGDGKAVVGPMLREYVIGEAMHALGIPTTRALAVVATGEEVSRGPMLPGAVLTRVAASHIRVGTFQYAAMHVGPELVRRLADHAIARHHPDAAEADNPYLALYASVVESQASLVARWMLVGFIHGVMNTDNMAISGETIDYGPCAFMDAYDAETVFSSIDHGGRYAYGNQPLIAQWNLARFAETLLPLLDDDDERARTSALEILQSFPHRFHGHWLDGMGAKLGLDGGTAETLLDDLFGLLATYRVDYTSFFRALAPAARGNAAPVQALFTESSELDAWAERWRSRNPDPDAMDRVNPRVHPAQSPRGGGAGRGHRGRHGPVPGAARRPRAGRTTSAPGSRPTRSRRRRATRRTRRSAGPSGPSRSRSALAAAVGRGDERVVGEPPRRPQEAESANVLEPEAERRVTSEGSAAHDPREAPQAILGQPRGGGLAQEHRVHRIGSLLDRAEHALVGLAHEPRVLLGVDPFDLLVGSHRAHTSCECVACGSHRGLHDAEDHRSERRRDERSRRVGLPAPVPAATPCGSRETPRTPCHDSGSPPCRGRPTERRASSRAIHPTGRLGRRAGTSPGPPRRRAAPW